MPKLDNLHPIEKGLKIGTFINKGCPEPYWYARMYWKTQNTGTGKAGGVNKFLSTKVPYEGGSTYAKNEAIDVASRMFADFKKKMDMGVSPLKVLTISDVAKEYLAKIDKEARSNDKVTKAGGLPRYEVEGGKGHWTGSRVIDEESHCQILEGYWKTLPTQDITGIKERHLDSFKTWGVKSPRKWSPSTINRYIVTIRHIYRYAKNKGYVDSLPSPSRARENLKERSRRDLKPEEYRMMTDYLREKYTNPDKWFRQSGVGDAEYRETLSYQFHNWVLLMANSGIRTPSGKVDKNLIRWRDIVDEKGKFPTKKSKQFMIKRNEKGHEYKAVVRPDSYMHLEHQMDLQKEYGIFDKKDGYVFAHCFTKAGQFNKGDPIKSFRKQWQTMMEHLDLNPKPEDFDGEKIPASAKLVPYSLRGWFITARLIDNKEIRLEDLAQATGTSVRMLEQTYYDFDTSKVYDTLTYTDPDHDRSKLKRKYNSRGRYIGREAV